LVRDDHVRKEITKYVGKQALVLTIVECKGLEFQVVIMLCHVCLITVSKYFKVHI
jgi:hypothetical protein